MAPRSVAEHTWEGVRADGVTPAHKWRALHSEESDSGGQWRRRPAPSLVSAFPPTHPTFLKDTHFEDSGGESVGEPVSGLGPD